MPCNEGPVKMSLYSNQASLGDMLMCVWRWTGRIWGQWGRGRGPTRGQGVRLRVSPSGPPGWPTGRCSCSGQDPAGSKRPAPPSTGTKRCLETSRERRKKTGRGRSNGEIISVRCLQLKGNVWRRAMTTKKKKKKWEIFFFFPPKKNGMKWILKMQHSKCLKMRGEKEGGGESKKSERKWVRSGKGFMEWENEGREREEGDGRGGTGFHALKGTGFKGTRAAVPHGIYRAHRHTPKTSGMIPHSQIKTPGGEHLPPTPQFQLAFFC